MKPVGVILDFDKGTVEYVTPKQAVKAATPSKEQHTSASAGMPAKPKK